MPIRVVAKGRVREGPTRLGEEVWVVFVLDPFPDISGTRLAHACEVVCRREELASSTLGNVRRGDRVEVAGQMVLEGVMGPIEDDLSAVRAWIKATRVSRIRDPRIR